METDASPSLEEHCRSSSLPAVDATAECGVAERRFVGVEYDGSASRSARDTLRRFEDGVTHFGRSDECFKLWDILFCALGHSVGETYYLASLHNPRDPAAGADRHHAAHLLPRAHREAERSAVTSPAE